MDTTITALIDEAIERFAARELVPSRDVVDFLLDLRLAMLDSAALEALLKDEANASPN